MSSDTSRASALRRASAERPGNSSSSFSSDGGAAGTPAITQLIEHLFDQNFGFYCKIGAHGDPGLCEAYAATCAARVTWVPRERCAAVRIAPDLPVLESRPTDCIGYRAGACRFEDDSENNIQDDYTEASAMRYAEKADSEKETTSTGRVIFAKKWRYKIIRFRNF